MQFRPVRVCAAEIMMDSFALLLLALMCVQATGGSYTHHCTLYADGETKEFYLSCCNATAHPKAGGQGPVLTKPCDLVVYFNNSNNLQRASRSCDVHLASLPHSRDQDPSTLPAYGSAGFNATEEPLNRTEQVYGSMMWPFLYFYGGPGCNVLLENPVVKGLQLPGVSKHGTQVLVFGGGLSATLERGSITGNNASIGVMVLANSTLRVRSTNVTDNTLEKGAVYGSWKSKLRLDHVIITGNSALQEGAALYLVNANTSLRNSWLHGNFAARDGGAIYAKSRSSLDIHDCSFDNNTSAQSGGAVFLSDTNGTLADCNFTKNRAGDRGGAVNLHGVVDSAVSNNFSRLCKESLTASLDMQVCNVSGNMAPVGGAIAVHSSRLVIAGSVLYNNTARSSATEATSNYFQLGIGGGLYSDNAEVTIKGSQLTKNVAVMDGGAMRIQRGHVAIIQNSSLRNNKAHRHGGAVYLGTRTPPPDTMQEIAECYKAKHQPALQIIDSGIVGNLAEGNGGGIMLQPGGHTTIHNATISNNQAWGSGGGLCTEMAEEPSNVTHNDTFIHDLRTQLSVDGIFEANRGTGNKLYVGPYHNINFTNPTQLNRTSQGVSWFKRLCGKGEYVARSGYCELCESYKYSFEVELPGHRLDSCNITPTNAFAPGGAVLVPLTNNWHAVEEPSLLVDCVDCPLRTADPHYVTRCPNPSACKHNHTLLALKHPQGQNGDRYSWANYSRLLCAVGEGYEGAVCGTCANGFGMTSPFNCNACLGAKVADERASKAYLSTSYIIYWVLLSVWLGLSVWSAMPSNDKEQAGLGCVAKPLASPSACSKQGVSKGCQQTAKLEEHSEPLDLLKALIIYYQWASLVLNLPVDWVPDSVTNAVTGLLKILGMAFGRPASVDCLLQGWGVWQNDTMGDIIQKTFFRAFFSAFVVPNILCLTVLLMWAIKQWVAQCSCLPKCLPFCSGQSSHGEREVEGASYTHAPDPGSRPCVKQPFHLRLFTTALVALLVTFFDTYDKVAKVAWGMLLCVRLGTAQHRCVLDVRLQCPSEHPVHRWQVAAVAIGTCLLVCYFFITFGLAFVLAVYAYHGQLSPAATVEGKESSSSDGGCRISTFLLKHQAFVLRCLQFRYADYKVEELTPGEPQGRRKLANMDASLDKLRCWAVLTWDSILDMHRMLLALVALCVMLHELHQLILVVIVLSIQLCLMLAVQPWKSTSVASLQVLALSVVIASCFGIMACNVTVPYGMYAQPTMSLMHTAVIPWVIIALNLAYMGIALYLLARSIWFKLPQECRAKDRIFAAISLHCTLQAAAAWLLLSTFSSPVFSGAWLMVIGILPACALCALCRAFQHLCATGTCTQLLCGDRMQFDRVSHS